MGKIKKLSKLKAVKNFLLLCKVPKVPKEEKTKKVWVTGFEAEIFDLPSFPFPGHQNTLQEKQKAGKFKKNQSDK